MTIQRTIPSSVAAREYRSSRVILETVPDVSISGRLLIGVARAVGTPTLELSSLEEATLDIEEEESPTHFTEGNDKLLTTGLEIDSI
ncbi:hypothetical protein ACEPAG_9744 [Sanghuangporus baumii]